jgi:hypothetical protein
MNLRGLVGKGKKKDDTHKGKPSKKQKLSKGETSTTGGNSSNVPQPPQGPPPPTLYAAGSIPLHPHCQPIEFKFYNEAAKKRYVVLRNMSIHKERGFAEDLLLARPEIEEQLVNRGWKTYNDIVTKRDGDERSRTLLREFFANAFKKLPEQKDFLLLT